LLVGDDLQADPAYRGAAQDILLFMGIWWHHRRRRRNRASARGRGPDADVYRNGPAAAYCTAPHRRACVLPLGDRANAHRYARAYVGGARLASHRRDLRLGRETLDRADDTDARHPLRFPVEGTAQAHRLVRCAWGYRELQHP